MKNFTQHYKIYEDGRVQRIDDGSSKMSPGKIKGKFLKPEKNKNGRLRVTLCHKGVTMRIQLHRLIALTFIPNPDNLPVVNHKDGNPLNNHVDNLEWASYSYNLQHSYDELNRDRLYGTKRTWAKLTEDLVRQIRKNEEGLTNEQWANKLNVSYSAVYAAATRRAWQHVE